ncbi:MAG: hypothetical protein PHR79_07895 [Bacteroidales bacterium]|nr:hypothetical protein [Bacteroidales bacterium]
MQKRVLIIILLFFWSLNLSAQVYWLFQVEHNGSIIQEMMDVGVRYKNKADKWSRIKKANILYGSQPELGVLNYYHLRLPAFVSEFELEIKNSRFYRKLVVFSIPDTISENSLVLMSNLSMGSGIKKIPFYYAVSKIHQFTLDTNILTIEQYLQKPFLESQRNYYDVNSEINIVLKQNIPENAEFTIPGCGAPGTRYVVQKWMHGDWYNYINTWEHKCVTTNHNVKQHIYAFRLQESGIYRLLLKGVKYKNRPIDDFYSNVFINR